MTAGSSYRRITLCVDDFGLSQGACLAAIQLAAAGQVSAVSAVVDGEYTGSFASSIMKASSKCSVGLHFNLTERIGFERATNLQTWLVRGLLPQRWRERLRSEVHRQLDRFERLFGCAPAFVDGHEHVHQLSVTRDPLLEVLRSRYSSQVAVRSTVPLRWRGAKATLIAILGGYSLLEAARSHGITVNSDFAGVYDFSTRVAYERRMRAWLGSIADRGLVMCHPEHPSDAARAQAARLAEYKFLSSPRWPATRTEFNVQLVPFSASA